MTPAVGRDASEPELVAGSLAGWRMWRIGLDAQGPVLSSVAYGARWPARRPMRARCRVTFAPHPPSAGAAHERCACGICATSRPEGLVRQARSEIRALAGSWLGWLVGPVMLLLLCPGTWVSCRGP